MQPGTVGKTELWDRLEVISCQVQILQPATQREKTHKDCQCMTRGLIYKALSLNWFNLWNF